MDHDITPQLRSWLHETIGAVPDPVHIYPAVAADARSAPRRRGWLPRLLPTTTSIPVIGITRFAVVVAVAVLVGGLLLAGVMTQPRAESVPGATDLASPDVSMAAPEVATDDALWAAIWGDIRRVDAATSEVTVIPTPSDESWLVPTDDAVWALGGDAVHRVDRASLTVTDSIDVSGGPAVLADGSLWIWSLEPDSSTLIEIDLETRAVVGEYSIDDESPIGGSDGAWSDALYRSWISMVDDAIWMHESTDTGQVLIGFDPETHEFTDRISIDEPADRGYPWSCCLAVDDAIWLPGPRGEGTLRRFDPATLEVTDTLELGPGLGGGIAAAGAIWMNGGFTIHRIDPVTMEVTDIPIWNHRNRPPAYGDGAVWVSTPGGLSRIDVDSLEVSQVCGSACGGSWPPIVSNGVAWIFNDAGPGDPWVLRVDTVTGSLGPVTRGAPR